MGSATVGDIVGEPLARLPQHQSHVAFVDLDDHVSKLVGVLCARPYGLPRA